MLSHSFCSLTKLDAIEADEKRKKEEEERKVTELEKAAAALTPSKRPSKVGLTGPRSIAWSGSLNFDLSVVFPPNDPF